MKPKLFGMLGALCALAGGASMASDAPVPSPSVAKDAYVNQAQPKAVVNRGSSVSSIVRSMEAAGNQGRIRMHWKPLNQRQKRLARRRRHAAGCKKAFR